MQPPTNEQPTTIQFSKNWIIDLLALNDAMASRAQQQQQCPHHCHTCDQQPPKAAPGAPQRRPMPSHRLVFTLPWKHHPLYLLRKSTLLLAIPSVLCSLGPAGSTYGPNVFAANIFFLILSFLVCLVDLVSYAHQKARDLDTQPKWPKRKFMVADVLLALALVYVFLGCMAWMFGPMSWYETEAVVFGAWGALGGLICGILHATAFWKELMARKKNAWLASLPKTACERCGYTSPTSSTARPATEPLPPLAAENARPNIYPYAGPSAEYRSTNILTPEHSSPSSEESAMEEGLLLGSDFEGGYQTISREAETVVEQPEGVVVGAKPKKGKGKERKKEKSAARDTEQGTA